MKNVRKPNNSCRKGWISRVNFLLFWCAWLWFEFTRKKSIHSFGSLKCDRQFKSKRKIVIFKDGKEEKQKCSRMEWDSACYTATEASGTSKPGNCAATAVAKNKELDVIITFRLFKQVAAMRMLRPTSSSGTTASIAPLIPLRINAAEMHFVSRVYVFGYAPMKTIITFRP